jgi:hypothetical protein
MLVNTGGRLGPDVPLPLPAILLSAALLGLLLLRLGLKKAP